MRSETAIKKDISDYLISLGADVCYHVVYHSMGYGRRGVPDRLVCYKGRFLALEVKRPPEERKPNPDAEKWQQREIAAIIAAGGKAVVVWDVEHVKEVLRIIDREIAAEKDDLIIDTIRWGEED